MFDCKASVSSVAVNTAFTLYCTAVVAAGAATSNGPNIIQPTLSDSVVSKYSGFGAWADVDSTGGGALLYNSASTRFDTTGAEANFASGKFNVDLKYTAGSGAQTILVKDGFCTGLVTISIASDSVDIFGVAVATNATHETNVASILVYGWSSSDSPLASSWDTVLLTFGGKDSVTALVTDSGVWQCTGTYTFRDTVPAIRVIAYLYSAGAQVVNDTITILYDGTSPRLTKIGDTSLKNGDLTGPYDTIVFFYVVDTGAGFDGAGSCTLYWHIDSSPAPSGGDTNFVQATAKDNGSGTWTIEATIPVSSLNPDLDTKIGFWWVCQDDVKNRTLTSSLSSPAYLDNDPGTFTVEVVNVRDVVISEIMWDGDNSQGDMEYVELYNTLPITVNLSGWKLSDANLTAATGFTLRFSASDTIPAFSYFVIWQQGDGDIGGYGFSDSQNHYDTLAVSDWDGDNDLAGTGDSITIWDNNNVVIDSAPFTGGWPAGGYTASANDTQGASMERVFTGTTRLVAGSGDSAAQWDSNTMRHGTGGRPHGTPGHANSINVPNIIGITPKNPVQNRGRAYWDISITNGNVAFANGGKLRIEPPADWSPAGTTSTESGYCTVQSETGGSSQSGLSTLGRSLIVSFSNPNPFPANATINIRYGDNSTDRRGLAQTETAPGRVNFQLYFDTDATVTSDYEAVGDTDPLDYGFLTDSIIVVVLSTGGTNTDTVDTSPSSNPKSFIKSDYQLTRTVYDSQARLVYAASVSADTDAPAANPEDTMFPLLSEYSSFTGFYQRAGTDSTISGWTNSSGEFTFTVKASETVGMNIIRIWNPTNSRKDNAYIFNDTARSPVPTISEVMWAGGGEYFELYNPTHAVQSCSGWALYTQGSTANSRLLTIDTRAMTAIGYLNPFTYVVIPDTNGLAGTNGVALAQDSGFAPANTAPPSHLALNLSDVAETVYLVDSVGAQVDIHLKTNAGSASGSGWHGGLSQGGGADSSMERVYPTAAGTLSSSWATSDSRLNTFDGGGGGAGTPGRPNARSLEAYTGKPFDRLDTFMPRQRDISGAGRTDTQYDTARINFVLRIANGDTQPGQQVGCTAVVERGPANFSASSDSSLRILLTPTDSTNSAGTTYIQVSSNANNFSGTVTVKLLQPYGVHDSAYIIFDRGESLGYIFMRSETNITVSSSETDLLIYVGFADSFSGLFRSGSNPNYDSPQLRWKFHKKGVWSSFQKMNRLTSTSDTYWARIDISPDTYGGNAGDTVVWQVTWRDQAGNYDTSPDTFPLLRDTSFEYITPIDTVTIMNIRQGDTIGGKALLVVRIRWSTTNTCTVVIEYDTATNKNAGIYDSITIVESGPLGAAGGESTLILSSSVTGNIYNLHWITRNDLPDTKNDDIRLRVRVYDADNFGYLGETTVILAVATVLADPPQKLAGRPLYHGVGIDTAYIRWGADTYAQYYTVWRDSGGHPVRGDTERLTNVTMAVFGTDSRSVDTFIYDTGVRPRTDTYFIWYVTSIDTWNNIPEDTRNYSDSISAEYIYVTKRLNRLINKYLTTPDTRPGTMIEYQIIVSNTEGYSPAYNVQVKDWIPFFTDYKETNTMIDTGDREDTQTDNNDTDYLRYITAGDSRYIQVDFPNPFAAGDTAKIRFRVIIR